MSYKAERTCYIQELILEAYRCISDPDGVYGTGAGTLADTDSRYTEI